jgi:AcrR family transcriptional regulator
MIRDEERVEIGAFRDARAFANRVAIRLRTHISYSNSVLHTGSVVDMAREPQKTSRENRVGRPAAKDRKPYSIDALLDVAVRVFLERGYDGASLDDVARAARITKASIYYHVRSKEELLMRGVGRAFDALFAVLEEPAASKGAAVDRLRHVIRRTVEITAEMTPEVALLLRVRGNTRVERKILERRREFDHLMAQLFAEAQNEKGIRDDLDARLATRLLFGMLNSITEWYRREGALRAPELVEAIFRIAFEGLEQ